MPILPVYPATMVSPSPYIVLHHFSQPQQLYYPCQTWYLEHNVIIISNQIYIKKTELSRYFVSTITLIVRVDGMECRNTFIWPSSMTIPMGFLRSIYLVSSPIL